MIAVNIDRKVVDKLIADARQQLATELTNAQVPGSKEKIVELVTYIKALKEIIPVDAGV